MPISPLNGTKTHPLTKATLSVLERMAQAPIPSPEVNPGVSNRLRREDLAESVNLPSSYKTKPGLYPHLRITDKDRAALTDSRYGETHDR